MKTFFFVISLILSFTFLHAQEGILSLSSKVILESDNDVYFDEKLLKLVASGNARLENGSLLLTADRIEFDQNRSLASANGKVILTDGDFRILAKDLEISLQTGDFNASEIKTMLYPVALKAKKIERENFIIHGIDSSLYFLEEEPNEPNLNFQTIKFNQKENTLEASGVVVKVGNKWVGRLPSFSGKTKHSPWKYKVRAGNQNNLGWFLGIGGKWQLNPTVEFDMETTAYSKRGWLFSPGFSWSSKAEENILFGNLDSGWINDQGKNLGTDQNGQKLPNNRAYIRAYNYAEYQENLRFAGQFEYDKDSEIYRDYQRDLFYQNQWNDSYGEISYQQKNWTLSTMARWQANEHQSVVEQLPTIRFDLHPTPWLDSHLYHSFAFEFSSLRSKDNFGNLIEESKKFDFGYEVTRPISLPLGITYSPQLAYRSQDYSISGPDAKRSWAEIGNELRYTLFADYNWDNSVWQIDQIRHVMGFSITHRKINRLSEKRENLIPVIDDPFLDMNLRSIDLMNQIQADNLKPYEVLRLGWEHEVITKQDKGTRSLASLALYHDLYYKLKEPSTESREFFSDLTINPAHWISVRGQSKFDVKDGRNIRNSISTLINDGIFNQIEIGYFKYLSSSDQWRLNTSHRIDDSKFLAGTIAYNSNTEQIPFWQSSIEYKTSPFWTWIFSVSGRGGTNKENDTEISLSTRIFAF